MDVELAMWRAFTRLLPPLRGARRVSSLVARAYARKPRPSTVSSVFGFQMRLDPAEYVDQLLLFSPQLYDTHELAYVRGHLQPGDVFLDIGAHIGLYSLTASRCVGPLGRVLAFEADPYNYTELTHHLEANQAANVKALPVGVSDKHETLRLGINTVGNRGANSFLGSDIHGSVQVECHGLFELLEKNQVARVAGAKLDIEGFEFRVLKAFLEKAPAGLWPGFLVLESMGFNPYWESQSGGDPVELLLAHGYRLVWKEGINHILARV